MKRSQSATKEPPMFGLYRSRRRLLTGVAAGVAGRIGVHPVLVRLAWIVSVPFTFFLSVLLYAALAATLPLEPEGTEVRRPGWDTAVRQGFAVFWGLHGAAHLVGFLTAWRLTANGGAGYSTAILWGQVEIGEPAIRLFGLVWLAMVPLFVLAAIAIFRNARSALPLFAVSAVTSLLICVVYMPAAAIGLWINAAALALLVGIVGWRSVAHTTVAERSTAGSAR